MSAVERLRAYIVVGEVGSELSGGEVHPCGSLVVVVIGAHYGPSRDGGLLALKEVVDRSRLVCATTRVQGGLSEVVKHRWARVQ